MCSDTLSPLQSPSQGSQRPLTRVQTMLLKGIRLYQTSREGRPSPCRFWPTCSHYGYEAIETHGSFRGSLLTLRRLSKCRPFGPSGVDPVPDPRPGR